MLVLRLRKWIHNKHSDCCHGFNSARVEMSVMLIMGPDVETKTSKNQYFKV